MWFYVYLVVFEHLQSPWSHTNKLVHPEVDGMYDQTFSSNLLSWGICTFCRISPSFILSNISWPHIHLCICISVTLILWTCWPLMDKYALTYNIDAHPPIYHWWSYIYLTYLSEPQKKKKPRHLHGTNQNKNYSRYLLICLINQIMVVKVTDQRKNEIEYTLHKNVAKLTYS